LARDVSARVARLVLDSRMAAGVRPYPGFFRFTADIWDHPYATPDGRRRSENLSYGAGPASAVATTPTSVLRSMRHVAHELCACGNPLALSLQQGDVRGEAGIQRLIALVTAYFGTGGFHLHFNVVNADDLRRARLDPENHRDLTVRISGLSARFVCLPAAIQNALIERAEHGV
jgi:formate C-acetyltransferase